MLVIPAIDLQGGRCVRLEQGRQDAVTVYGDDPLEMARYWVEQGARYLHIVDLDGAFSGRPVHAGLIARLIDAVPVPVEVGGGLRTDEDVRAMVEAGADRVILGTRACAEPEALRRLIDRYGNHIAVGIDARNGLVQVRGWVETTTLRTTELARRMDRLGVATIIVTDTATDGMLSGTNAAAMDAVCEVVQCGVIASGGISSPDDMEALRALGRPQLKAVIVGKALYEGTVTWADLNGHRSGPD